ncbi:MAG: WhiB family transcriptional regulator, partial [Ilumatobacteraceae bacterium]
MSGPEISWRQRGACHGLDPSIFFPDSEENAEEAKSIVPPALGGYDP